MESNVNIENQIPISIKPLELFKQNRKIPISEKLKAIEFSKVNGNKKAAQKFGVTSKSIRRWKKMKLCIYRFQTQKRKLHYIKVIQIRL